MRRIRLAITVAAPRHRVWECLADLGSQPEWMADAEAIRFTSGRRSGVGTTMECDTRFGPIRVTDLMEVTEWDEPRALAVRHDGAVTGTGRFRLLRRRGGRTRIRWEERVSFPWWLGGSLGEVLAAPVMRWMWRGNLRRLRARVEDPGSQRDGCA